MIAAVPLGHTPILGTSGVVGYVWMATNELPSVTKHFDTAAEKLDRLTDAGRLHWFAPGGEPSDRTWHLPP